MHCHHCCSKIQFMKNYTTDLLRETLCEIYLPESSLF